MQNHDDARGHEEDAFDRALEVAADALDALATGGAPRLTGVQCHERACALRALLQRGATVTQLSDDVLIAELQRRGWRFTETRIPVGYDAPAPRAGERYIHGRQLQHSQRVDPDGAAR